MAFLGMSWNKKVHFYACSVDNVIDGAAKYIRQNGAKSFEKSLIEPCQKFENKQDTLESFNDALTNLVDFCRKSNINRTKMFAKITNPVIVLFSTWPHDTSKDSLHNLTLQNWKSFMPKVEFAVFTNSSHDKKLAQSFGAKTLPILHHAGGGAPVLKSMFLTIIKMYPNSSLFGYVNSDILFTNKFTESLETIIHLKNMSKPLLLVGRRVNVNNILPNETTSYAALETVAKERGELFGPNAEDFFITNSIFPWKNIIDVVIGRIAYDNWLVGHVICHLHVDVIDLSDTVLAVHQTTKKGGNYEGFKSKYTHHNNALFKKLKIIPVFETGFTICAQELTNYNLCGDIHIFKRMTFWEKCKCPKNVLF